MPSVAYADCRVRRVSLMPSVEYAECHLCRVSLLLSVAYAEGHNILIVRNKPMMLVNIKSSVFMLRVILASVETSF